MPQNNGNFEKNALSLKEASLYAKNARRDFL
jgi:hypothetical protein